MKTSSKKNLGTFEPFDTDNALFGPSSNGVFSGTYTDGTPMYVGYGDNSAAPCSGENKSPGRISVNPASPGGYFTCPTIRYRKTGNLYLRDHPNLLWVTTISKGMANISTALKVFNSGTNFFFGRVFTNNKTYVGKIIEIQNNGEEDFNLDLSTF